MPASPRVSAPQGPGGRPRDSLPTPEAQGSTEECSLQTCPTSHPVVTVRRGNPVCLRGNRRSASQRCGCGRRDASRHARCQLPGTGLGRNMAPHWGAQTQAGWRVTDAACGRRRVPAASRVPARLLGWPRPASSHTPSGTPHGGSRALPACPGGRRHTQLRRTQQKPRWLPDSCPGPSSSPAWDCRPPQNQVKSFRVRGPRLAQWLAPDS